MNDGSSRKSEDFCFVFVKLKFMFCTYLLTLLIVASVFNRSELRVGCKVDESALHRIQMKS